LFVLLDTLPEERTLGPTITKFGYGNLPVHTTNLSHFYLPYLGQTEAPTPNHAMFALLSLADFQKFITGADQKEGEGMDPSYYNVLLKNLSIANLCLLVID
jgi:hypothetical protein